MVGISNRWEYTNSILRSSQKMSLGKHMEIHLVNIVCAFFLRFNRKFRSFFSQTQMCFHLKMPHAILMLKSRPIIYNVNTSVLSAYLWFIFFFAFLYFVFASALLCFCLALMCFGFVLCIYFCICFALLLFCCAFVLFCFVIFQKYT